MIMTYGNKRRRTRDVLTLSYICCVTTIGYTYQVRHSQNERSSSMMSVLFAYPVADCIFRVSAEHVKATNATLP